MQAPPPATNTTTTTTTTIEHPQLHQSRVLIAPPPPMPLVHPPSGDAYYGSDASLGSTATGTSSLSHSLYSSSRDSLGPPNGVQGHMPLPASRMNRPPSRGTLRSTASSTHNSQPHVQQQMQPPLGPALGPPPQSTTAAATTTLKVSVKQRNGSVATITTTPAKVTRGFSSSAASPSNPSAFVGSHGSQEGSIGRFGGSRSFEDSGILGFSPSQDSNAGFNAGTSYASSRHSGKSASDLHNGGIYGSGTIYASASGGDSGGVSGLHQNTRRMYSNASSASATSLQTFFGVGEGQALKERLKREQEMKEQYYQQMLALEQQQIRQQQQLLINRKSQKDLLHRSSSTARVDSKDVIQQHKEDEATTESTMSGGDRKASFAIGIEEDEFTDEEEDEENQEHGDSSQKRGRDFKASMRSSGSSDHQSGTISQNPPRKQSPNMLTPPDSSTVDPQFIVRPASRNNNHGNNTNSPLLTRRTFPSAPYLPLYNLPKPVSASVKSPTTTATKLLLNPNPNSSSAADIPVLSAKSSPAMNGSSSEVDTGVPAPPPIPITRTTSHQQSTTHVTNTTNNTMLKTQPPELQAPLHQTPSANAISEADIQAAAAAARARGQNLPRTIPEFYKRLQDLRGHNIQQLVALRDQISLLKKETKAAAGTADGTGPGNGVEYYEREMGRVIELARRDEGHLVEFGRRGMGIDGKYLVLV
ncbi:hypothetical protein HDU79_007195 [Rhizoclosmatium sp. JEL0117]|nr:hypothetical protein HDU79_007195 [Rhizoclosmatium sp. JEL0117]